MKELKLGHLKLVNYFVLKYNLNLIAVVWSLLYHSAIFDLVKNVKFWYMIKDKDRVSIFFHLWKLIIKWYEIEFYFSSISEKDTKLSMFEFQEGLSY